MFWEGRTDRFSSSFKKKQEAIVGFDLSPFNVFHSEGKHGLYNCGVEVKCITVFINHGVLDVCKFTLIFTTGLVTAVLLEKLFTCPQSVQNWTEDFQCSVLPFHPEIL